MSVNPRDDYEKLAKLLYPSIEASGNVYYGQTRKLTLDAVLNRNDFGFESWIKSQPAINHDESDIYVDSSFEWKLGPLHGSIAFRPFIMDVYNRSNIYSFYNFPDTMWFKVINPYVDEADFILHPEDEYIEDNGWVYEDIPAKDLTSNYLYGTIFAKYKINTNYKNIDYIINSGNYETYEHSIDTNFVCMCITNRFNPINRDDYSISDRHFFIGKESDGEYYLYVKVCTSKEDYLNYYNLPIRQELTFTAVSANASVGLQKSNDNGIFAIYQYSLDGGSIWNDYTFGTLIDLEMHQSVRFKMSNPNDFYYDENTYVYFIFNQSGVVKASGDIRSMLNPFSSYKPHKFAFYKMFYNCDQLITAPKILITVCSQSDLKCILKETFFGTSIKEPPKLLPIVGFVDKSQLSSSEGCYHSTFENCTSLTCAPKFLYREPLSSFKDMLKGCSSLKTIDVSQCISSGHMLFYGYTIYDAGHNNVTLIHSTPLYNFVKWERLFNTNSSWKFEFVDINRSDSLDEFCTSLNEDIGHFIISGSNSPLNGRGDLLDSTTLNNMEYSFDKNSNHQMDTYNVDGSFNQEIWGYKIFNSPVQFRNGIYDENISIIASDSDKCDKIIPNISAVDIYGMPTQSFNYISNVCTESLPTKCSKISCKNHSDLLVASTLYYDSLNYITTVNDPKGVSHSIEYSIDNYYSAYSEISAKDPSGNKEAIVYSSIKPSVDLSLSVKYFQDNYGDRYDISLTDSSFSTIYESGIVADESFINITSINNNSVATIKANKVNIEADIISLNNVTIMPHDHVNDSTITEYNNGGLYILGINLYNSSTSIVLNCGTSIEYTDLGAWYAEPQHIRVSVKKLKFSGTFVPGASSYSADVKLIPINDAPIGTKFVLLSPTTLSSDTNNISCAFAICTSGS